MSKFKVVNVDNRIVKAIGKKQNLLGLSDKDDTVIFFKNRFDYKKTNEKSIIKRLNTDFDVGKELMRFKDDIFMSLSNVNSAFNLNSQLPTVDVKTLNGLRDLQISLKSTNKTKFYLERISDTQKRIYGILKKIQEDLIDEQDTKIKLNKDSTERKTAVNTSENKNNKKKKSKNVAKSSDTSIVRDVAKSLKNVTLSKVVRIAGKVFKVAEVVMLLYYIAKNWHIADKSIDTPGVIEKCIFAIFAGVTEWVQVHLDVLSWLVDHFISISNWIINNAHKYSSYLGDYAFVVDVMVYSLKLSPLKAVCEYILKPVFDWLKTNGSYGAPLGVIAVEMYRSYKKEITNAVPNGKTYDLLFGETKLDDAQKAGLYSWSMLGNSQLRGSSKDLARISTKEELEEMISHNDLDEYDLNKVKEALRIKEEEHISDKDVMKMRNTDTSLVTLVESLLKNIRTFDGNKKWKKLWIALAQNSRELVKVNPESTVISFLESNGRPTTLNVNHLLLENPYFTFSSSVDAPETLCVGVCREAKLAFNRVSDTFWFTPYGTVVFQSRVIDPIQSKRYVDSCEVQNVKMIRGSLYNIYRVMGYFDVNFNFIKNVFSPDDIVFRKLFKYNIISQSDVSNLNAVKLTKDSIDSVSSKTSSFKSIPSYVANSYRQSYDEFDKSDTGINTTVVTSSEIKEKIWEFFRTELKLKDHQIAGIMGNLHVETGGFNMNNIQGEHFDKSKSGKNDGMSGGLCQWHDVNGKGRLSALKKFAKSRGRDWKDLDVQLMFLKYELETTYSNVYTKLLSSQSVNESASIWVRDYEKPADTVRETVKRASIGQGYLDLYKSTGNEISKVPLDMNLEDANAVNDSQDAQIDNDILDIARTKIAGTKYSQEQRNQNGYYDCSSFVSSVLRDMGFDVDRSTTTHYYDKVLSRIGFRRVGSSSAMTQNKSDLRPGDILLKKNKHIMIYNGNGTVIEANGYNRKNHNGINEWGKSIHNKYDMYEIWRYPNVVSPTKSNLVQEFDTAKTDVTSHNSTQNPNIVTDGRKDIVNNVLIAQNNQSSYEYEGMSEELFTIKI